MVYEAEVWGGSIFGEDWMTELQEFEREERSPSFFGVYAKIAEVGNGAVR